jgi:hypothetical protein
MHLQLVSWNVVVESYVVASRKSNFFVLPSLSLVGNFLILTLPLSSDTFVSVQKITLCLLQMVFQRHKNKPRCSNNKVSDSQTSKGLRVRSPTFSNTARWSKQTTGLALQILDRFMFLVVIATCRSFWCSRPRTNRYKEITVVHILHLLMLRIIPRSYFISKKRVLRRGSLKFSATRQFPILAETRSPWDGEKFETQVGTRSKWNTPGIILSIADDSTKGSFVIITVLYTDVKSKLSLSWWMFIDRKKKSLKVEWNWKANRIFDFTKSV